MRSLAIVKGDFAMRCLLTVLGVCVFAALLRAAPVPADEKPQLLIVSDRSGQAEIYLINADGTGKAKNLTNDKSFNAYPAWSPDRRKIAFVSDRDAVNLHIYTMDADGENVKQLTKGDSKCRVPTWSPDGKKIVFGQTTPNNGSQICVIDADGGNMKVLGDGDGWDPAWSPDGKKILFASFRGPKGGFRVYVMDADGSNVVQLTTNGNTLGFVYPSWSPDSKRIAWGDFIGQKLEIYVADADGKNSKQITTLGGRNAYPAWSPDGKKIAFQHSDDKGIGSYYIMDANGDNPKEILKDETPIEGGRPVWKPK
jgi:TolB protein